MGRKREPMKVSDIIRAAVRSGEMFRWLSEHERERLIKEGVL